MTFSAWIRAPVGNDEFQAPFQISYSANHDEKVYWIRLVLYCDWKNRHFETCHFEGNVMHWFTKSEAISTSLTFSSAASGWLFTKNLLFFDTSKPLSVCSESLSQVRPTPGRGVILYRRRSKKRTGEKMTISNKSKSEISIWRLMLLLSVGYEEKFYPEKLFEIAFLSMGEGGRGKCNLVFANNLYSPSTRAVLLQVRALFSFSTLPPQVTIGMVPFFAIVPPLFPSAHEFLR